MALRVAYGFIGDSFASAYTGDFGNWSPHRKLITGHCSQMGSGRQLSGSIGRQASSRPKKAAMSMSMCPLVTSAVDEGIGTLVGSSGLRASAAPPSLASASALRKRFRCGGGA